MNAYNYKSTEYSDINSSGHTWTRDSSGMVANYFGVVQPMGDSTVGFSIAIPNYDLEDQSDQFHNFGGSSNTFGASNQYSVTSIKDQLIDFNNEDNTTLAGVSYAKSISDDFSFGLTLYGYMRKKELTNWQYVRAEMDDNGTAKLFEGTTYQKFQTEEFGFQPRIGLMWAPTPKLSIGWMTQATLILSQSPESRYLSKGILCDSDGSSNCSNFSFSDNDGDGTVDADNIAISDNLVPLLTTASDNDLPVETTLGVAYFASDALLYTADFSYATQTDVYEATWNLAGGAEYFLDQTWAVRGGLYTNNANTKSNVSVYKNDHVNLYGGSFSVTRYTKGSNITAGINYSTGSGEADLNPGTAAVQTVKVNAFNMYISTSASF